MGYMQRKGDALCSTIDIDIGCDVKAVGCFVLYDRYRHRMYMQRE